MKVKITFLNAVKSTYMLILDSVLRTGQLCSIGPSVRDVTLYCSGFYYALL